MAWDMGVRIQPLSQCPHQMKRHNCHIDESLQKFLTLFHSPIYAFLTRSIAQPRLDTPSDGNPRNW